jgi:putative spermidine/putrescine transport system substrate-binding protein
MSVVIRIGLAIWLLVAPLSSSAAEAEGASASGEGLVDIIAWPGYIERGEPDPTYDWVRGF